MTAADRHACTLLLAAPFLILDRLPTDGELRCACTRSGHCRTPPTYARYDEFPVRSWRSPMLALGSWSGRERAPHCGRW